MELQEILKKHREYYLKKYLNYTSTIDNAVLELLIDVNSEEPEEIFRLYRYDLATNSEEGPDIKEFNADGYLNHQAVNFTINNKKIILAPISWNGVEISVDNYSDDIENIKKWAIKWIDLEDEKTQDSNNLQGVIHNITKPAKEDNGINFSVDFGSSPVEAALELIDILSNDDKATLIKLNSPWMTE